MYRERSGTGVRARPFSHECHAPVAPAPGSARVQLRGPSSPRAAGGPPHAIRRRRAGGRAGAVGSLGGASGGAVGARAGGTLGAAGGAGAARQPVHRPAVRGGRRRRPAGRDHPRLRRSLPLQDRLRSPPCAAAPQGRRAGRSPRPTTTPMSRPLSAPRSICALRELRLAAAGCALLDREEAARTAGDEAAKAAVAAEIEAVRRWCAAHLHDPALASWVVFRFPETLDFEHLVHIVRPDPARPQVLTGPEAARRRRDGFALTDSRAGVRESAERDPLLRALPRARQGQLQQGDRRQAGRGGHQPAGHRPGRLPARREDLGDAPAAQARRRHRGPGAGDDRQPDVPGHRPSHLQRLHEGLHLPEAGSGRHPAGRDRHAHRRAGAAVGRRDLRAAHPLESAERGPAVRAARTTARTCSSSVWARPATRWRTTW